MVYLAINDMGQIFLGGPDFPLLFFEGKLQAGFNLISLFKKNIYIYTEQYKYCNSNSDILIKIGQIDKN